MLRNEGKLVLTSYGNIDAWGPTRPLSETRGNVSRQLFSGVYFVLVTNSSHRLWVFWGGWDVDNWTIFSLETLTTAQLSISQKQFFAWLPAIRDIQFGGHCGKRYLLIGLPCWSCLLTRRISKVWLCGELRLLWPPSLFRSAYSRPVV
jgi:hypothetical protein